MLKKRIIPVLLLQENNLVKTIKFDNPKYIGDPINTIHIFNQKEVDELIILDINCSSKNREPNYDLIKELASECFMPFTYGGGIKDINQAKRIFDLGVEKICIQTSAINNFSFIEELINEFGSQSIVLSLDVKKNFLKKYCVFSSAQKKIIKKDWKSWLNMLSTSGCGEIILNSVDQDGTMAGPDLNLINEASKITTIPLVVLGGVSKLEDIKKIIDSGADAVAAGAFFFYYGSHRGVLITYPNHNEIEKLLQ